MFHRRFALPALIVSASLAFAQDSVVPSGGSSGGGTMGGSMITPFGGSGEQQGGGFNGLNGGQQGAGGTQQDLFGNGGTSGGSTPAQEAPSFALPGGYGFANQEVVAGQGTFARPPIQFSATLQQGYDNNIYSSSGKPTIIPAHVQVRVGSGGQFIIHDKIPEQVIPSSTPVQGSLISQASMQLDFLLTGARSFASLGFHGGGGYYWERKGDPFDPSGGVNLLFAYKATPRLQISGQLDAQYLSQPNYSLVNAPTQPGGGSYINLTSKFDANYQWTARFGTTTTLSVSGMEYLQSTSQQNNFMETVLGQSVNYRIGPRTTGVLEVRGGQVTYTSGTGDSTSQYFLGGVDFLFSQRFTGTLRVGEEYRQYAQANTPTAASPYLESALTYGYGRASSVNWTSRYGFEENSQNITRRQQTFRSGITVNQVISAKFVLLLGLNYTHSMMSAVSGVQSATDSASNQDNVTASLGAQYQVTRNVKVFGNYQHTKILTNQAWTTYSKDTLFLGVSYQF